MQKLLYWKVFEGKVGVNCLFPITRDKLLIWLSELLISQLDVENQL